MIEVKHDRYETHGRQPHSLRRRGFPQRMGWAPHRPAHWPTRSHQPERLPHRRRTTATRPAAPHRGGVTCRRRGLAGCRLRPKPSRRRRNIPVAHPRLPHSPSGRAYHWLPGQCHQLFDASRHLLPGGCGTKPPVAAGHQPGRRNPMAWLSRQSTPETTPPVVADLPHCRRRVVGVVAALLGHHGDQ